MSSNLHPFPTHTSMVNQRLSSFLDDLQSAMNDVFPTEGNPYRSVKVLFCFWENLEFAWLKGALGVLEDIFDKIYGYDCIKIILPTNLDNTLVTRWILLRLMEIVSQISDRSLIIFYYAGHGEVSGPEKECMLVSSGIPATLPDGSTAHYDRQIPFNSIVGTLEAAKVTSLYLMDCCYASAAALRINSELIAATAMENIAVTGSYGFTRVLAEVLANIDGEPITVAHLHGKLMREVTGNPGIGLTFTPIYAELHAHRKGSIVLAPLRHEATNIPPHPRSPRPDPSIPIFTSDEPKVIIRVRLQADKGMPDIEEFKRWLGTNVPPYIQAADIELSGWHMGMSSTLLLTLPVAIWNVLRRHDAYSFVDYVRGNNLLLQRPSPISGPLAVRPRQPQQSVGTLSAHQRGESSVSGIACGRENIHPGQSQ